MKNLSKKNVEVKKVKTAKAAASVKVETTQAQCCAKVSKVVAGCHD
ncbi:MAG: hypothetical protein JXR91_16515 [Deltaproteobacteria bacterium]|nr:hypothetical protein [Deltaproteobacteria bacterium]